MTDAVIFAFGCGVTFLTLAGTYVWLRGQYEATDEKLKQTRGAAPTRGDAVAANSA